LTEETQMSVTRRAFTLAAASLATPALLGRARAAEFALRFGTGYPATHPVNVRASEAASRIKDQTRGQVTIEMFPNSQLGGDSDLLSQLRAGALDFFSTGGLILSTLVRVASINGMGFAFSDYSKIWPAMDGDLGALIRDGFTKVDLHAFKVWDNGFREITTSTRPITSPADLSGFKIRVPVSPLYVSLFKALGASPTSINLGETYSALQTHIVDGQENPLVIVETTKFYEVQKYISLTNHIWDGSWIVVNGHVWSSMPTDVQDIITRNLDASGLEERQDVARLNATLAESLAKRGLTVNRPDPEPFRAKLREAGFYADWKKQYGDAAWGVLEKYVGSLT
jgi:TRAP-type transport system periplasmic protein